MQCLTVGISVRGVHQAMLNPELLMQNLSGGGQTIGRTTAVTHYVMLSRIVLFMVDAHDHRQVIVFAGGGDDDALSPTVRDMHGCFFPLRKEACGFYNHVNAGITPRDIRRIAFAKDDDPLAIDLQRTVCGFNGSRQRAEKGIMFEQMGEGFAVRQIVNCHNLHIRVTQRRAQEITSDTAETVNADLNHSALLISVVWRHCRRQAGWRKRQKRITLCHFATVEALTILARREVELFLKDATQIDAAAKPALLSNAFERVAGLFKQLPGGGKACFGDITRRRGACFTGEHAGEIARAHRRFLRQIFHAQVSGQVLQDPGLQVAYRAGGAGLLKIIATELQLPAGAAQIHHHILRHLASEGKTVIVFHQRQGQIKPGANPTGGPDGTVLNIQRATFHMDGRVLGLQGLQQPPVGGRPASIKQAGLGQQHRAAANGGYPPRVWRSEMQPVHHRRALLLVHSAAGDNNRIKRFTRIQLRQAIIRQQIQAGLAVDHLVRLGGGDDNAVTGMG
ncbi:DJ-1/PfpI Family Protein [Enterobacter ludwigii]|uniref:DJ-1/PfpI Family Protein n=1 Tax=Enterobacter ludwigii TaxID=299767 RepID=G8LG45_9ENTR|nr:DJ-1/PfpI Family Protein [Enterobacter ludwigii]